MKSINHYSAKAIQVSCVGLVLLVTSIRLAAQDPKEVLNRNHISPKAAEFARQGNIPVNLSVGKIGYTVPIHTLRLDGFEWPVSLSYGYSGLLLEGKPSDVGLGWSLSGGGGAVVRQVNGLPDEHDRGYWGQSSRRSYIENYVLPGSIPKPIVEDFLAGKYDSQPDKFVVSAGEMNLTFFIRNVTCVTCPDPYKGVEVTTTLDNTKVSFTWARIEVTDAKGIKYVFEDTEITPYQTTDMQLEVGLPGAKYTSAWNLSEIVMPNNKKIEFNYAPQTITSLSFSETFDRTKSVTGEMIDASCDAGGIAWSQTMQKRELNKSQNSTTMEIAAKKLTSIRSPETILQIDRNVAGNPLTGLPLISAFTVEDYAFRDVHSFQLTYLASSRPLLGGLVKDNLETYSFEYNPVAIPFITQQNGPVGPNVAPYQQDFWGFANGKANQSSIPERGGDRRPAFGSASEGALTRITYPTGGSTQIMYEPNTVKMGSNNILEEPESANASFSKAKSDFPSYQWYNVSYPFHFDKATFVDLSMSGFVKGPGTELTVEFSKNGHGLCGDEVEVAFQRQLNPGAPVILDLCMTVGLTGDGPPGNCGSNYTGCKTKSSGGWVLIPPGDYTATMSVYNTNKARYTFSLKWYDPDLFEGTPSFKSEIAAGIRVRETMDCPGNDAECVRKVYKYITDDGYPSGRYLSKIDYSYDYEVFEAKDCRDYNWYPEGLPLYEEWNFMATNYSFRTLNPLEMFAGNPVYYDRVEVWNGETITYLPDPLVGNHGIYIGPDLFLSSPTNGREVKYFEASTWGSTGTYPYRPLPDNPINGAAFKIDSYLQSGEKVKEIVLDQSVTSPSLVYTDFPQGMVFGVAKVYKYSPFNHAAHNQMMLLEGYKYNKYYVDFPTKLLVNSQTETSFHPKPESVNTAYTYNGGLQLKTTTVVGSDGKTRQTKHYYPHEITGTGYQLLTTLNEIASPVKTEEYVNGAVKRTSQTDYVQVSSNPLIVEPSLIYTQQGGITFTETTIHAYNSLGNPIEFTGKDGIRTAIQWGYPSQGVYLYPDMMASNASANEVFYTSFEYGTGDEAGNSIDNDSHSGLKSRSGVYSHPLSGLTLNKDYVLTWWSKAADGKWSLNTLNVPNPGATYSINLTGQIDDVRFHPKAAQMTSYTFKPGIGVTTTSDLNSVVAYYEYDSQGRLSFLRDANGKILKKYDYHYKGE